MVHSHTVHLPLGALLMTCTMCGIDMEESYRLQRSFYDRTMHSVPLFLVAGNHDGPPNINPSLSPSMNSTRRLATASSGDGPPPADETPAGVRLRANYLPSPSSSQAPFYTGALLLLSVTVCYCLLPCVAQAPFYTGAAADAQSYYAFEWGDALIIALDVYSRPRTWCTATPCTLH